MKNLKKVFAVVIALALMLSSVAFAAFPDVESDATYAAAVENLAALGLVKGDDKGNFNPNDSIKRSEVAAMLVRAYGQEETATAIAGAGMFTDVPAAHWANGYIRYASESLKFINGMGDGTFAPDADVTFEQTVKMIVSILGYEDLAAEAGGYPAGYMTVASDLGILKGVSLTDTTAAAKRSTVAQLLNNGLDTPLRKKVSGGIYATYENQDGKGDREYHTLLTDKLGVYKVTGKVTATSFNGNLPVGQINYDVIESNNLDDEKITKDDEAKQLTVIVGDTNAEELLYIDSEALLTQNEDEEWVMVSIVATGKNEIKELKLNALDTDNSDATELRFFKDENKTGTSTGNKNTLAEKAVLYVNSVKVGEVAAENNYKNYIENNTNGTITLVAPSKGKEYNTVLVTYAVTAVVDGVNERLGRISFKDVVETAESDKVTRIEIDPDEDDENFSYSIVLDGEEIEIADLQENDVVTIAYNVDEGIAESNFYNVIVSRNFVEGNLTSTTKNKAGQIEYYDIAGKEYKVDGTVLDNDGIDADIEPGDDVVAYLDIYGNIVAMEKSDEQTSANVYGFALAAKDRSGFGDYCLQMVNAEGETVIYDFADKVILEYPGGETSKSSVTATQDIKINDTEADSIIDAIAKVADGTIVTDETLDVTDDVEKVVNRAISYTLTDGEISKVRLLGSENFKLYATDTATEYTESKLRLKGTSTINVSANTVVAIPDDEEEDEVSFSDISVLKDGAEYTVVYAFDKNTDDNTAGMIMFGEAGAVYNENTAIAIVTKKSDTRVDGVNYTRLTIIENGETKTIEAEADEAVIKVGPDGYTKADKLDFGDVIIYDTDSKGYVKEIRVIMTAATEDNAIGGDDNFIAEKSGDVAPFGANFEDIFSKEGGNVAGVGNVKYPWKVAKYGEDREEAEFAFGVVKDRSASANTMTLYNQAGNDEEAVVVKTNDDTNVYIYDITGREAVIEVAEVADIALAVSSLEKDSFVMDGKVRTKNIAQWYGTFGEDEEDQYELANVINYAMVKSFDGVAQDIVLVIVNAEEE